MIDQEIGVLLSEQGSSDVRPTEDARPMSRLSLLDICILFARRKVLIAAVTVISLLCGILTSFILPTRYTAVTKIMTPQQTQSTTALLMNQLANSGAGSLAAVAGGGGLRNPDDVYLGMLNSRPIADAIISQFSLMDVYRAKDLTAARNKLASNTKIASQKGGLIFVSVIDKDRKRASDIANAYVVQLRSLMTHLAITEAGQRRFFFEEQLKHAKEDLVAAEYSFQQVQQKRGLVQLDMQAKTSIEGLAALNSQVTAKQVELQALLSYSTEHNADVQLVESQLASLQAEATRMENRRRASGSGALGLQDVAGTGMEYLSAQHELQYRQVMFDLLLKQYDAARLDEAKDAAVVQVVEPAIPPERRSSPQRVSLTQLFGILGFLGACSYVFLSEVILKNPETSRSLEELRSALASR